MIVGFGVVVAFGVELLAYKPDEIPGIVRQIHPLAIGGGIIGKGTLMSDGEALRSSTGDRQLGKMDVPGKGTAVTGSGQRNGDFNVLNFQNALRNKIVVVKQLSII